MNDEYFCASNQIFVNTNELDCNKICRVCLKEEPLLHSIFYMSETLEERLVDMIVSFASIEINSHDGLPLKICIQCVQNVHQAYIIKRQCERSDHILRELLAERFNECGEFDLESSRVVHNVHEQIVHEQTVETLPIHQSDVPNHTNPTEKPININTIVNDDFAHMKPIVEIVEETVIDEVEVKSEEFFDDVTSKSVKKINQKDRLQKHGRILQKRLKIAVGENGKNKIVSERLYHTCNICKKKFVNMKSFRKHLNMHLTGEDKPIECNICSRRFSDENYLKNHMVKHIPDADKPLKCNVCDKRFMRKCLLDKHKLKHTNNAPYKCQICNRGCYAENSLLKHMKIHKTKSENDDKYVCDYCQAEFNNAELYDAHIKSHALSKRPFACNTCGKCFPQMFNLQLHKRKHTGERPFACEVCKNGYVSKAALKIHMRTHTNERPFVCQICSRAFRQCGDLNNHKRTHNVNERIECSTCHKSFTTVIKLKYHMRNHTGERPYVCKVCNRGFTINTILMRHMRVHSGERPYVCVICGRAFSQSSTLRTHMRTHMSNNQSGNNYSKGAANKMEDGKNHYGQLENSDQKNYAGKGGGEAKNNPNNSRYLRMAAVSGTTNGGNSGKHHEIDQNYENTHILPPMTTTGQSNGKTYSKLSGNDVTHQKVPSSRIPVLNGRVVNDNSKEPEHMSRITTHQMSNQNVSIDTSTAIDCRLVNDAARLLLNNLQHQSVTIANLQHQLQHVTHENDDGRDMVSENIVDERDSHNRVLLNSDQEVDINLINNLRWLESGGTHLPSHMRQFQTENSINQHGHRLNDYNERRNHLNEQQYF